MTKQVLRSQLAGIPNFEQVVEVYAKDLRDWVTHQDGVAAGTHEHHPAPHVPALVDECVRRPELVPDFAIVEDLPAADRAARDVLLAALGRMLEARAAEISPPGKRALAALRYGDAMSRVNRPEGRDEREPAEKMMCAAHEERARELEALHRRAAEISHEIEEVPAGDLASWRMPEL